MVCVWGGGFDCLSHLPDVYALIYLVNFCTDLEKVVQITIMPVKQILGSSGSVHLHLPCASTPPASVVHPTLPYASFVYPRCPCASYEPLRRPCSSYVPPRCFCFSNDTQAEVRIPISCMCTWKSKVCYWCRLRRSLAAEAWHGWCAWFQGFIACTIDTVSTRVYYHAHWCQERAIPQSLTPHLGSW